MILKLASATIQKIIFGFVAFIALYALLGFFVVPSVVKQEALKTIESKFGVKAEIKKISFNPFTFELTVKGFDMPAAVGTENSQSRLKFDVFSVNMSLFPLLKKEIHLSSVVLKNAQMQFIIFNNGTTNWVVKEDEIKKSEVPFGWILNIEHVQIEKSGLDFVDRTHVSPWELPLGPLSLQASNISTTLGTNTDLNSLLISVGDNGHVKVSGSLRMKPFSAAMSLDVAAFPLDFVTAYLSDKTLLSLKKGNVDVLGNVKYEKGNILFEGSSEINDLSIEQEGGELPVLVWEKMQLKDIKLQTKPMSLRVREVNLLKPRTEIVLRKDGTLNFKDLMRSSKTSSPSSTNSTPQEEEKPASAMDYLVTKVNISDGSLDYSDQQIRPRFATRIHGLEGQVGPISSNLTEKINVTMAGLVEAYGKFEGQGHFIPGVKTPSLNLDMHFHNIELTTFTPYSGKFAGYEISKGKLFLDIKYILVNNRIKGKNQILLDQFTLGNKIESENSTNWPVKFALALMKDRKGQIKFKLPVEGDVHSPSFSWGNLIWTAIKNMVINIVSAPFDFIASLVGAGPELQTLLFEPGTNSLLQSEGEKFQKIAQLLEERPELALEIIGQYQDQDTDVLQHNNINRNLEPFLKKNKGDRPAAMRALAQSILKKEDFNNLVSSYQASHGNDEMGLAQVLENKLAATVVVSDDELKALALARGKVVMTGLSLQKVNMERVYLLAGTRAEKGKPSQVLLNLREK